MIIYVNTLGIQLCLTGGMKIGKSCNNYVHIATDSFYQEYSTLNNRQIYLLFTKLMVVLTGMALVTRWAIYVASCSFNNMTHFKGPLY